MKKIVLLSIIMAISVMILSSLLEAGPVNIVGKWDLIRVENAAGKPQPLPPKPKMGGAEFFKDNTVMFSDNLKGQWTISADGNLNIVLMQFVEMTGAIQGDILKLTNEVNPDEVLVLKKQK